MPPKVLACCCARWSHPPGKAACASALARVETGSGVGLNLLLQVQLGSVTRASPPSYVNLPCWDWIYFLGFWTGESTG